METLKTVLAIPVAIIGAGLALAVLLGIVALVAVLPFILFILLVGCVIYFGLTSNDEDEFDKPP